MFVNLFLMKSINKVYFKEKNFDKSYFVNALSNLNLNLVKLSGTLPPKTQKLAILIILNILKNNYSLKDWWKYFFSFK